MLNILIIEDDVLTIEFYKEWVLEALVRSEGAVIDISGNGTDARARLNNKSYDMTILDIAIPGESGVDLYNSFSDRMGAVLLSSSYADIFSHYLNGSIKKRILNKPFNKDHFIDMFCDILKESGYAYRETDRDIKDYEVIP